MEEDKTECFHEKLKRVCTHGAEYALVWKSIEFLHNGVCKVAPQDSKMNNEDVKI